MSRKQKDRRCSKKQHFSDGKPTVAAESDYDIPLVSLAGASKQEVLTIKAKRTISQLNVYIVEE